MRTLIFLGCQHVLSCVFPVHQQTYPGDHNGDAVQIGSSEGHHCGQVAVWLRETPLKNQDGNGGVLNARFNGDCNCHFSVSTEDDGDDESTQVTQVWEQERSGDGQKFIANNVDHVPVDVRPKRQNVHHKYPSEWPRKFGNFFSNSGKKPAGKGTCLFWLSQKREDFIRFQFLKEESCDLLFDCDTYGAGKDNVHQCECDVWVRDAHSGRINELSTQQVQPCWHHHCKIMSAIPENCQNEPDIDANYMKVFVSFIVQTKDFYPMQPQCLLLSWWDWDPDLHPVSSPRRCWILLQGCRPWSVVQRQRRCPGPGLLLIRTQAEKEIWRAWFKVADQFPNHWLQLFSRLWTLAQKEGRSSNHQKQAELSKNQAFTHQGHHNKLGTKPDGWSNRTLDDFPYEVQIHQATKPNVQDHCQDYQADFKDRFLGWAEIRNNACSLHFQSINHVHLFGGSPF